jgi:threonine dehydratase
MRSLGAELIEHGRDFDEAKEQAVRIAAERGFEFAPSFHRDFVIGVATYALELFTAVADLDTVYETYRTRLRHLRSDRHARCAWA